MPRPQKAGELSLRLLVEAGSIMEEDDQRGVAHLVEHMAFNGTRHFPAGEALAEFQRLGIRRAADANASTGLGHTSYELDLPDSAPESVGLALQFLRDVADGILFVPAQLEQERKVVLAEMRERYKPNNDWLVQFAFPESRIGSRRPIGVKEVIEAVPRQRVVEFYQRWYTPDRMVLVAVGVIDDDFEDRIPEVFGSMAARQGPPDPDIGKIVTGRAPEVGLGPDPTSSRYLALYSITGRANIMRSAVDLRRGVELDLANMAFQKELRDHGRWELHGAEVDSSLVLGRATTSIARVLTGGQWEPTVNRLAEIWRRVRDLGPGDSHLARAKSALYPIVRKQAERALDNDAAGTADALVKALSIGSVFMEPAAQMGEMLRALREADSAGAAAAFNSHWTGGDLVILAAGEFDETSGTIEDHLEAGWRLEPRPRTPPPERGAELQFGEAGSVLTRVEDEGLGFTQCHFANGVALAVKPLATLPDTVTVQVSFGDGSRSADGTLHPWFAETIVTNAGTVGMHRRAREEAFAGRDFDLSFDVLDSCFQLSSTCSPEEVETACAVLAEHLTAPRTRDAGRFLPMSGYRLGAVARQSSTASELVAGRVNHLLRGEDRRAAPIDFYEKIGFDAASEAARSWIYQPMREAPLEITIVGDISTDAAIRSAARTFGALDRRPPPTPQARPPSLPAPSPGPHILEFTQRSEVGNAILAFQIPDSISAALGGHTLNVLAAVVQQRMVDSLREELGQSYAPRCSFRSGELGAGDSFLTLRAPCDHRRVDELSTRLWAIVDSFESTPVTIDERDRACRSLATGVHYAQRLPRYWLRALARPISRHGRVEGARRHVQGYESLDVDSIRAAAGHVFGGAKPVVFKLLPERR